MSKEQAVKLRECLDHIDELICHKAHIEKQIFALAESYAFPLELIRSVPGFSANPLTAIALISEIGVDMSVFPTAKHLSSWAGCCPRNDQSGGKIKSTRISRAGSFLKPLLVQIANSLVRSDKHPEFSERFRKIKARRGHKKAIIAICRMILTAIWHILSKLEPYSSDGFVTVRPAEPNKVLSTAQALNLLKSRGYIIKDDVPLTVS